MRPIDADKLKPDMKIFLSAYAEELTECYSLEAINNATTINIKAELSEKCSVNKIAKKAVTHNLYICPDCNHFVERFEYAHGNNEIKYCKWCGCKMNYEE